MYSYDDLIQKLNATGDDRTYIKAIVHSLINNNIALVQNQKICVDFSEVKHLWDLFQGLSLFFDYKYNTKEDLSKFFTYVMGQGSITFNAIFCPGYTQTGYKNYIGTNNRTRLVILELLKKRLQQEKIDATFKITLADVFLENTDTSKNAQWREELLLHTNNFIEEAKKHFSEDEIITLSTIFSDDEYITGFTLPKLLCGKNYENFFKNNVSFYQKMDWAPNEIKNRNDRLYTIYTIISEYISKQQNGIYLPMETMYSRSKVMTYNNVASMYLHK